LVVATCTLYAQQPDQLLSEERLIPVQGGTAQLDNGVVTIILNENSLKQVNNANAQYLVSLTPIGDCGPLKVQQKLGDQFVVKEYSQQGTNGSFDYVVFVKRRIYTGLKPPDAKK
jgi:hypothetical protein